VTTSAPAPLGEWPHEGLERVERCPACSSTSRRLIYADLVDSTYMRAPGRWQLFRCVSCSCAYLDPRPNAQTIHLAYDMYYEGASAPPAAGTVRGWRPWRRALRNGYLNSRYGYRAAPSSRLGALVVPLLPRHRERADELVRHLHAREGHARLLDIGCGEGTFLADMQALGWSAQGIEPTGDGAEIARRRGVAVAQAAFPEVSLSANSFDAVTMRLVFEALPDPVEAILTCRRALKPGGIFWIASPSLDSLAHRVFGRNWIFLDPPRHAVLYTPSSLIRLMTELGFSILAMRPSRQAPWSYRTSAAISRGLPPFRQPPPLSRTLALRARLADLRALRRPELADVVVVLARKS
jgi:SAM-dependent methyltransferase